MRDILIVGDYIKMEILEDMCRQRIKKGYGTREMRWKEVTTWALIFLSYANGIEVSIKSAPWYKSTSSDLVILQQQRQHTVHGEELPYVLGVPLDNSKYNLRSRYDIRESLFSEAIMNWWCSFAYIGWVTKKKCL